MNNKILGYVVLALILSTMIVNNLESQYTFKTIINSIATAILVVIAFVSLYKHRKNLNKNDT